MLEMLTRTPSNAIIIHGGGLVEPSKFILLQFAKQLTIRQVYSKIYLGRYSFEALYTPEFWLEYNEELEARIKNKRGTWFGTCRGIDLTDPVLFKKAVNCMKKKKVTTLIVVGGDGSARQCAETEELFKQCGINVIFPLPLTVDGINGGRSVGLSQAVREVIRQTENVAATSLETRDNGEFSVVMVETQGRNRDDIMANVLKHFHLQKKVADIDIEELLIIAVPANMKTDIETLSQKVNRSKQRTLIFISEGSDIKIPELTKKINRKVRSVVVGHQVQSNNQMNKLDENIYQGWIDCLTEAIQLMPKESYSLVSSNTHPRIKIEDLSYYAKLNPRKGQIAEISDELNNLIKQYMV